MRQQSQEHGKLGSIEAQARRQLPEDRPQLASQREDARCEEVSKRDFRVAQPQLMGDETRSLHRENE